MVDLVFQMAAFKYASYNKLSGSEFFSILVQPAYKECEPWEGQMLKLWHNLLQFEKTIKSPCSLDPENKKESFFSYFSRVVQQDYPDVTNPKPSDVTNPKPSERTLSFRAFSFDPSFAHRFRKCFWKHADLPSNPSLFSEQVENRIHKSKCFVLLNWMIRQFYTSYFDYEDLTFALCKPIDDAANLSFFPKQLRADVVFDLNMLAYHLKTIHCDDFKIDLKLREHIQQQKSVVNGLKVCIRNSIETLLLGLVLCCKPIEDTNSPVAAVAIPNNQPAVPDTIEDTNSSVAAGEIPNNQPAAPDTIQSPLERERKEKHRPLCRNVVIPYEGWLQLKQLIFEYLGCLRRDFRLAVDFGEKQGIIRLELPEEITNNIHRNDFRWFVPFLTVSSKDYPHSLYARIESLLHDLGLIDLEHERLEDVGLIFGGSTYQYIHHDFVAASNANESDCTEALEGPYLPASILIGLGSMDGTTGTRLAVQANSVADCDDNP
jgi:hypothetical protein